MDEYLIFIVILSVVGKNLQRRQTNGVSQRNKNVKRYRNVSEKLKLVVIFNAKTEVSYSLRSQ